MCESCHQIPAGYTVDLGQDGRPFRVCGPCFMDAMQAKAVRRG